MRDNRAVSPVTAAEVQYRTNSVVDRMGHRCRNARRNKYLYSKIFRVHKNLDSSRLQKSVLKPSLIIIIMNIFNVA